VAQQLEQYESVMLSEIARRGLPGEGVLVSIEERRRLLANLDDALERLLPEHRSRSLYLSKFVMAVGAGLFDAALNYLWDETISELRRRVVRYDLAYFYDLAVTAPDRRKRLQGEESLPQVDDSELIRASNLMGLVSDVGYRQLDLVRYMRNFASAAHPNQNELTGLQLVGFLETCIREVITLPESNVVAEVRKLLANLKSTTMEKAEAAQIALFFANLPLSQADNLGQGLFGIYVDLTSSTLARNNVRLLWPALWPLLSEAVKQGFGARYGRFIANHDQQQAEFARELLDLVDAASYLPEDVRVAHIDEALDALAAAHVAMNNFHTEPPLARRLQALVGNGVPQAVRAKFCRTVVDVFLGRASGISWAADVIYRELITSFSPPEARIALLSYYDVSVTSKLQWPQPTAKYEELLVLLEGKFTDRPSRELFEAVRAFTGPREAMRLDTELRRLSQAIGV
jgi:hypothetical protein